MATRKNRPVRTSLNRRLARAGLRRSKQFNAALRFVDEAHASIDVADLAWVRDYLDGEGLSLDIVSREGDRVHGVVRRRTGTT